MARANSCSGGALQLGHAGEGVEIMNAPITNIEPNTLQLGHAGEGVEIAEKAILQKRRQSFNWATPVKAWRSPGFHGLAAWPMASIGPRR